MDQIDTRFKIEPSMPRAFKRRKHGPRYARCPITQPGNPAVQETLVISVISSFRRASRRWDGFGSVNVHRHHHLHPNPQPPLHRMVLPFGLGKVWHHFQLSRHLSMHHVGIHVLSGTSCDIPESCHGQQTIVTKKQKLCPSRSSTRCYYASLFALLTEPDANLTENAWPSTAHASRSSALLQAVDLVLLGYPRSIFSSASDSQSVSSTEPGI